MQRLKEKAEKEEKEADESSLWQFHGAVSFSSVPVLAVPSNPVGKEPFRSKIKNLKE